MSWLFDKLKEIFLLISCINIDEKKLEKSSDSTIDNLSQIVNFPDKNEDFYIDYDDISDITWDGD
tara:strand:- start:143 stop:337 length:195 start_codon:yes stop_codon:yes gene_type:complete